ncbi:acetyl-CoA decarbonylase/synthase complex subunit gamma [Selenihalanaerobacter shriftii]|uniref:CO-methylating acetyl-CoA synthase corrinoid iron-sulfur protein large subunit n=1 Tax=Selenihalanaerobacter shriftii TaxID=142842 RepID=A0A1T4K6R3_9FIRM|nr:acetyl-CoA decarbonylase/synthase complex subunit gamma [Selenihalanaerobacter shriftii]SJZ38148.1 CO-methylating acetyl-CoA synthase corrinoid iron-sulfur protein large subunit precursor [Selenihalanaerobacter shriftii]
MGLTGLEIYKKLPQTNCGECGPPTCLAFAMQLAEGKAKLDQCPDVSDEAKQALNAASAPPIETVAMGTGDYEIEVGGETELFRHDKTFFNQPGVAISVSDEEGADDIADKIEKINALTFERVGQVIELGMIAVVNDSDDADTFVEAVKVVAENTERTLILVSQDPAAIEGALAEVADRNPLIYAAVEANYEEMTELAKENECPLAVKGDDLDSLAELTKKVKDLDYDNLVIDSGSRDTAQVLADQTVIRRLSIKKKFRPVGFPTITFTEADTVAEEVMQASTYVSKYAGIVVLSNALELAEVLPLLTVRQNIYTDPRVPVTVEPNKVYEVGEPDETSPVFITTNFSLSYYSVEGDVSGGKLDAYIIPIDTDGTSVLTGWAADKFGGKKIGEIMTEETDIEDRVNHKKVIIPGHVAVISGKLEEASGWDVLVGPRECSGIPSYIASRWEQELGA